MYALVETGCHALGVGLMRSGSPSNSDHSSLNALCADMYVFLHCEITNAELG